MSALLLKIEHLEVRYGDLIGVSDVSLDVPEGSVVALLGSNGGGKTTVLNAVAGLIPMHSGSIEFNGQEIGGQSAFSIVRKGLALSPEGWRLFVQQTVEQNLRLGATVLADKARIPALLDRVFGLFPRLAERRKPRAGTLSGGERQMLATGRALMSDPVLLMLDEPSLGLAPAVVESMYETLARLRREGLTLLLAEQAVELALEVADYAYVLQTGRTVLEGPAARLADDKDVQRIYLGLETEGI
ncbi:high-affinity branched-chain amino acid transport ATP-binding protein LivF [mine drainage metagenome]|uniref:High-affinity branched-chain amino acid transport ATP-binding protein LivF n=1 Tax=mine drainage metagenome TaxID=410659 RepID=A0A1J5PPR6_9ZZZZ